MADVRNVLNRIGLGIAAMFGIYWAFSFLIWPNFATSVPSWADLLIGSAVLYGIGFPLLLLFFGKAHKPQEVVKGKMPVKQFLFCFSLQFTAFLFLVILSIALAAIFGTTEPKIIFGLDATSLFILLILNPIAEEYIFRKLIADRLRPYGDKLFIFVSAFCFSIVHGVTLGIPQVVYTYVLGLIWAYALVKTGGLLVPIILHSLSNLFGAVISLLLGDAAGLYTILLMLLGLVTLIIYIIKRKKIKIEDNTGVINIQDIKHLAASPGILFYTLLTMSMIVVKMALLP